MRAQAGLATGNDWREALEAVLSGIDSGEHGHGWDLAFLFASDSYGAALPDLAAEVRRRTGTQILIGCTSQGVIGTGREIDNYPGVSLLLFSLPGADLETCRIQAKDIEGDGGSAAGKISAASAANAWFFFIDPFSTNGDDLLRVLETTAPGIPVVGGLASATGQGTALFLNDEVFADGAVGVSLGGAFTVRTLVSQGAMPIGEAWTVTETDRNVIRSIAGRPAFDILRETFLALDPDTQARAQRNLLVGLAMNEYRDTFGRGDFLIRNLVHVDQASGAIAIGALPREGQTIQFQVRDPDAADEELRTMLNLLKEDLGGLNPMGALLCSCNGRGSGLFGIPDHDAGALADALGPMPVAGFFCNGEIGPIDGKNFLHGYTASIALIVPVDA